jgi:NAD(P)-binding Rossmann-like domain
VVSAVRVRLSPSPFFLLSALVSTSSMTTIDTDYLIVGAGAAGMAFADSLIAESDADVVIVDRRHRPGGHWNDAYPFVRLHQPSAFYGVNSRVLGSDSIDEAGPNAGFYGRATGAEICDYFQRVLEEHLLASGQVRYFGMCDYIRDSSSEHRFISRLTGEESTVRVRRKVVDATYLEPSVPSTHTPSFEVDPNVRLIPINDLVTLTEPGSGYTVIGAGKTAMDACIWLLDSGVAPEAIRWIRPRDAWILDRAFSQPLERVGSLIEGVSLQLEAATGADNVEDLFRRLEACGQLIRLDPTVEPTMYHCAVLSQDELKSLRLIENVVRQGRVAHVGEDRIELEAGSTPTDPKQVYVDCTGDGIRRAPVRAIFEPNRITLQQVRTCQPTFNAALIAFVESVRDNDAEKNRLCPPHLYPDAALGWLSVTSIGQRTEALWFDQPDLMAWLERSRLNGARGIADHATEPQMQSALARLFTNREPAIEKLESFLVHSQEGDIAR